MHLRNAVILLGLGAVALIGWRVIQPSLDEASQINMSDAGEKGIIHIGIDSWIGYFPLCSPVMKRQLRDQGYGLKCTDDQANYSARFKALSNNTYDYAVATVDSYLLNAKHSQFSGPIIAVIDESKGGDAIVAKASVANSIDALKKATNYTLAYTPDSPSHHLIKAVSSHFDVPLLKQTTLHKHTQGAEQALNYLLKGDADVAVLWEPELSKALQNTDFVRLLGTEATQDLIVDILIASQDTIKNDKEKTQHLLKAYFTTLKYYRSNKNAFINDIKRHYKIKENVAKTMLSGVSWATLYDNAHRWFGITSSTTSSEAIIHTLNSASHILVDNNDFKESPIPQGDPYRLINSSIIKKLYSDYDINHDSNTQDKNRASHTKTFSALSDAQWSQLKDFGSLKTRKIRFSSGNAALTQDDKNQIDQIVSDLTHYPYFRIEVRGHTGVRGDKNANLALSQKRARAVVDYIYTAHSIDLNRIRPIGFGGTKPLSKKAGESKRAYSYRLPRVEIALVKEVY